MGIKGDLSREEYSKLCKKNEEAVYKIMLEAGYTPQQVGYYANKSKEECLNILARNFTFASYRYYNTTEEVTNAIKYIIENDIRLDDYYCAGKMTQMISQGIDLASYKDILNDNPMTSLKALLILIDAKENGLNIDKYLEAMQKHKNTFSAYCLENLIKLQKNGFNMDQFLSDKCFADEELHETSSTYSISGEILEFFLERKDDIAKLLENNTEFLVTDKLLDTAIYATQTTDRGGYGIADYKFKASMYIHNQLEKPQNKFEQQKQMHLQTLLKGQLDLEVLQKKIADSIIDGSFEFEFNNLIYTVKQIPASDLYEVKGNDEKGYESYIYNKETSELTDASKKDFKTNDTIDNIGRIARNEDVTIL